MAIDDNRRRKGLNAVRKKQKEQEKLFKDKFNIVENFDKFVEEASKKTGKTPLEISSEILNEGYSIIEFDETTGKASLVYESIGSSKAIVVPEATKYSEGDLKSFRDLRENFPPVSAGIEWHRDFTAGGGHTVQIDDPKDEHKQEMKKAVEEMERTVYQDVMTVGMDNITDIMVDIMFTEGLAAAEMLYGKEVAFDDYVEDYESVEMKVINKDNKEVSITTQVPVLKDPDWKELGGVTRLKVLDDAYSRLKVYRHPISGEILFLTLDEKAPEGVFPYWTSGKEYRQKVVKFHPWEIFWLSTNRRGPNLKGISLIQAVFAIAKMIQDIQTAVGKGFKRWANRKYFFILGSERRPWNKETQKRFLVSMKQMIQHDYVGFPVPFGFDVKSIGGEDTIFEGKNFLDYLTGLICAGMQYPREFLEVGRTQAGDKAWIAWRVRYGRNQLQVRRAIEQQIWRRHLWCKFGLTYRISKKGVKIEDQELRNIYIPKLEWRSEGKWLQQEEIKMLISLLNVANPVNPILKVGVEKKMAETLGIGELDWADTMKLTEISEETRLTQAERDKMNAKAELEATKNLDKDDKLTGLYEEQIENKLVPPQKEPTQPVEEKPEKMVVPTEEELRRRIEERTKGGVSRTTKETDKSALGQLKSHPEKLKSKELGGTRVPKRVGETEEEEVEETISVIDEMKELRRVLAEEKTLKEKQAEDLNFKLGKMDWEIEKLQKEQKTEPQELKIIHETQPQEITIKSEPMKVEPLKQEITIKSEPIKSEPLKVDITTKSEPIKLDITTTSEPAKVDATVKIEGIPEKITVESKGEVEIKGIPDKFESKSEVTIKGIPDRIETKSEVEVKGIPERIEIESKSQPVDVNVKVETQTPQSIEETKQREESQKTLINKQIELEDKKAMVLEEERQDKKKLREKIEKKLEEKDDDEQ